MTLIHNEQMFIVDDKMRYWNNFPHSAWNNWQSVCVCVCEWNIQTTSVWDVMDLS